MYRRHKAAREAGPSGPASPVLPAACTPDVAAHAPGPFVDPVEVIPSEWSWKDTRTYVVVDEAGKYWRALRVATRTGVFMGYWIVEPISA